MLGTSSSSALAAVLFLSTVACGPGALPAESPTEPTHAAAPVPTRAAREVPKGPPFELFATLKTSGAETCRVTRHELGPAYFLSGFPTPVEMGLLDSQVWSGAAWVLGHATQTESSSTACSRCSIADRQE